jgi:hypothetical protein
VTLGIDFAAETNSTPMKKVKANLVGLILTAMVGVMSCDDDDDVTKIHDINSADKVSVDRFSAAAGHLMVRDATNGLPEANMAINFDQAPFITKGLGPSGELVEYYNFDLQSDVPAPIYVLFKEGESSPVSGQFNIIDVIPGDAGYNDFWLVNKVTVPSDYQANQVASLQEIQAAGYPIESTTTIVNCPVVPEGSTASKRIGGGASGLIMGWYKEKVVTYFSFEEKALGLTSGKVSSSPIYVSFNINPSDTGGGPASGFKTEAGTDQTHNVVATVPADASYSPLWLVYVYDNADFEDVSDLETLQAAGTIGGGQDRVNCPVVSIQ